VSASARAFLDSSSSLTPTSTADHPTTHPLSQQDNLLWERLTAREHLLFYGRLKNLAGAALTSAVEAGLRSVNLASAADRPVGGFSGGMKRRLSVAISLIGDPLVVYLDEVGTYFNLRLCSCSCSYIIYFQTYSTRPLTTTSHAPARSPRPGSTPPRATRSGRSCAGPSAGAASS
jgi:ABC-type uncharacterized transport system YnjBCD ATPase subunit